MAGGCCSAPALSPELAERIEEAKRTAALRRAIEAEIPAHLFYAKGWPTCIPTSNEAALIASIRSRVSHLLHLDAHYLTEESVRARYADLLEAKRTMNETRSTPRRPRRAVLNAA
jgi:hypothetical protein